MRRRRALEESDGDENMPTSRRTTASRFPKDCHWNDVRAEDRNVGQALQHAMREIEKANPDTLYGIFGDAQWTNKDRLSDALLKT